MAVLTPLCIDQATALTRAHSLGDALAVEGIAAGSVNSNFFIDAEARRVFGRIYEEQGVEGVAYEWALLDHLHAAGLLVPERIAGPRPGEMTVEGKPTALFELMPGEELCQATVTPVRARAVGQALGHAHLAGAGFAWERASRFGHDAVERRLGLIGAQKRPELADLLPRLVAQYKSVVTDWPSVLPSGVIHGDLFRDNVRWEGNEIVGLLDWESASHGQWAFDVAVTILAWCHGDEFDWDLAGALIGGYTALRPFEPAEWSAFRTLIIGAAIRFTVTRITDFHLRPEGQGVKKDYRRFVERLAVFESTTDSELRGRLDVS